MLSKKKLDKRAAERVAIAKDALAWIEAGALIPSGMCYINPVREDDQISWSAEKQLRDIELGPCKVCAKGALFLAKAVRYDNVVGIQSSDQLYQRAYIGYELLEHFDQDQLKMIESYFEGWERSWSPFAATFKLKYPDHKQRLTIILKNIIDNGGTMVPYSRTDLLPL